MLAKSSLPLRLAAVLPSGVSLRAYHVSTTPTSTSALFAPSPGNEERTSCESHFLAVSTPGNGDSREVLIYAIEVLIFTTKSLTTLFVSKADSSGFSTRLDNPKGSPSVVAVLTAAFVEYLLEPRLARSRVVLSLFARAQRQYLFPGSSENVGKHVLDDRHLIKWWCRIFDGILRHPRDNSTATAHLLVPGCDKGETKAFYPPSTRADPPARPKWINSYPVDLMVTNTSLPPRHLVPRLPDDPKARFLDDLDGEFVDERGNWRSVKDLTQFWEFMSYRQECSAGRLVGFLWLVFSHDQAKYAASSELQQSEHTQRPSKPMAQPSLLTPGNSQQMEHGAPEFGPQDSSTLNPLPTLHSPPPSSPLQQEPEPIPLQDFQDRVDAPAAPPLAEGSSLPVVDQTRGEIVFDAAQYQTLMDYLLQTDFTGEEAAVETSRSWIDKALELSRATSFGQPVLGCATPGLAPSAQAVEASSAPINVLTGVRKKRKVDVVEDASVRSNGVEIAGAAAINTLAAGLVRKKTKS
ncbi:DNA damage response protein [Cladophialophora carrionii]|uniref:histone acetyltransferase n=1 Tax=Cladophialophora carrionii TaxID=86049 RepID=A0A1C1CAY7_9EURO|nr:DNA damage response protein [Cladophialophora carrionii]